MTALIYLGTILSVGSLPVALVRLSSGHPWPWCGIFLALALGTIGVSVWSLRQTRTAEQILAYLVQHGESYALSMVDAGIGARGTIYVHLHQLEEGGLVSSRCEPAIGRLPRRLYSITDLGRKRQGIPSACHEAGASPHPVRRATLLTPLALLLPRPARAAQPDPFREAALTSRRAWRRQIAVTMAIARLAPGLRARWPWHDVPQFANNIEWALSCDSSPEELVAFAATAEEWRRILGRLRPGADVLGAVRRAMARPVADEEVERGETAALASYRAAWMEHAAKRRAALPGVLAVLRGAAVALLLVLVGCLGPEPPAPDDLAPEVVSTDGGVVRLYKPDLSLCTPATRLDTLDNCGACGHSCRGDEWPGFPAACCPWIEQPHIGRCAILNTDNDCSGCGDQCTGGRHCVSGRCVP